MERMTRKDSRGYYIEDIGIPYDEKRRGPDVDRLGAYEDKGVAPEDALSAVEMAKVVCKLAVADAYIATGLMPERVAELAKAEQTGRLVVLPLEAKEGDPIPQCFYGDGGLCPGLSAQNDLEPIEMCKRCWYCSCGYRQEAEEALGQRDGGVER